MAETPDIPQNMADLLSDPERIRAAFQLLDALRHLEVFLVAPGGAQALSKGSPAIQGDPPNLILPLPLQLPSPIADSTATAASVSAQLNSLLAGLRKVGLLPP